MEFFLGKQLNIATHLELINQLLIHSIYPYNLDVNRKTSSNVDTANE